MPAKVPGPGLRVVHNTCADAGPQCFGNQEKCDTVCARLLDSFSARHPPRILHHGMADSYTRLLCRRPGGRHCRRWRPDPDPRPVHHLPGHLTGHALRHQQERRGLGHGHVRLAVRTAGAAALVGAAAGLRLCDAGQPAGGLGRHAGRPQLPAPAAAARAAGRAGLHTAPQGHGHRGATSAHRAHRDAADGDHRAGDRLL